MCIEVQYGTKAYDETVALRAAILRTPLGLEFSSEELYEEKDSFHLAYRRNTLGACLVLQPLGAQRVRMRQFAVHEDWQGQGVGRSLLNYSESFARDRGYTEMVLHARETAVDFYSKAGYKVDGARFVEVTIPHVSMRKELLSNGTHAPDPPA